ncbi:hypothetical protein [Clostridium frigidicarnis]|uniref:Ribose 5-phosphate isomerase n=1 Tax=Clostridium frigidicarnis TaxID=84698 RepID=A0A1I0ZFH7_9CLOT|nr:hypothetical protein [Clostridium frigidicarnis]SFB24132.1 hypothetical protein SAMN04488528_102037 [Clostridium frigidicarnis]
MNERYLTIIKFLCERNNISESEIVKILEDRECKYLLFLLLKKYGCDDKNKLKNLLPDTNNRMLTYNFRKAEEKLLVNSSLREKYFELESRLKEMM